MLHVTLLQQAPAILVATIIFILLILLYLLGYTIRKRAIHKNADQAKVKLGTINGTLLGFLGLLLAFTFSLSSSRFDNRRQLVIEEANAIGTAILRTDVYPDSVRNLLRSTLKEYLNERIAHYEAGMNFKEVEDHYRNAAQLGSNIWTIAATYAKKDDVTTRTSQLLPALNVMIDVTTTRRAAGESTVPDSIMYFLFILCCCSAFLLGYDHKQKIDWIIVIGFAVMLSATVFTIIDLDRPRSGLINMDLPNQKIVELREMFNN